VKKRGRGSASENKQREIGSYVPTSPLAAKVTGGKGARGGLKKDLGKLGEKGKTVPTNQQLILSRMS